MRIIFLLLLLGPWLLADFAYSKSKYQEVKIADPYIELHTGPGSGHPIFHVEDRGKWIEIIIRKTDWFKVRTEKGKVGWVNRDQLEQTLTPDGEKKQFEDIKIHSFTDRRWELGALGGDFDGANVFSGYVGYGFTPNISSELTVSQVLGDFSDSWLATLSLLGHPFPDWRLSPFFTLGGGVIKTEPNVTLVQTKDRTDATAHVGVGARIYLSRRFIFRAEYKNYVVFSSKDDNEEIQEWKAGIAIFF